MCAHGSHPIGTESTQARGTTESKGRERAEGHGKERATARHYSNIARFTRQLTPPPLLFSIFLSPTERLPLSRTEGMTSTSSSMGGPTCRPLPAPAPNPVTMAISMGLLPPGSLDTPAPATASPPTTGRAMEPLPSRCAFSLARSLPCLPPLLSHYSVYARVLLWSQWRQLRDVVVRRASHIIRVRACACLRVCARECAGAWVKACVEGLPLIRARSNSNMRASAVTRPPLPYSHGLHRPALSSPLVESK